MGAVYLVANPELPRNDALKLLSAELSRDPSFRARFDREASVASQLDHPNITSIYRRGATPDGQLWISMQFIDGTDADAALRAGTMTPNRAAHIVREVAKALDYAHNRQVIHRDVKPANFLLSGPIGPDERVVLADFGIARAVDDASITSTGAVMATLAYAAPEVLLGRRVDGRTDTYSLACSLYRMLTGKTPYQELGSSAAVMNAHLNYPPPRVTDANPNLPQALDQALATAMAKDPGARFQSSGAFANAVAAAFQPAPTQQAFHASPPHPGYGPHSSPHLAAAGSGGWQSPAPAPAPVSSAGKKRPLLIAGALGAAALLGLGVVGFMASSGGDDTKHAASSSTSSSPTPTAKPIKPANLPALLPSVEDLDTLLGASGLEVKTQGAALSQSTPEEGGVADRPECLGLMYPLRAAAYDNSGYTGVWAQRIEDQASTYVIQQGAASFPDAAQAETFFNDSTKTWKTCASSPLTTNFTSGEETFTAQPPVVNGDTMTTSATIENYPGWVCTRALGHKSNVVFDIHACAYGATDEAESIMNEGMGRVSEQ